MATIGVTRGLGDHDLKVYNSNIYIKPFLSCVPEVSQKHWGGKKSQNDQIGYLLLFYLFIYLQVKVYNLDEHKHGPDDVLVMGTDGLWDVTTDSEVADAVSTYLSSSDPSDPMRYWVWLQ